MGIAIYISQAISAELAIINNFIWNNYWSFSHKKIEHNSFAAFKSFGKFNAVALGSLIRLVLWAARLQVLALHQQRLWLVPTFSL
jgi:dolichol-phosphate mannosyltransferase